MSNKFAIYHQIGKGGMGVVYLGKQLIPHQRWVSIKQIHPGAEDDKARKALSDEAKVAFPVTHANVVSVYDFVKQNNEPFIVFEYVHGASLADLIQAGLSSAYLLTFISTPVSIKLLTLTCAKKRGLATPRLSAARCQDAKLRGPRLPRVQQAQICFRTFRRK